MKNQPGNMKNQPGTMKNHENRLGTMENRPGTINKQKRYKQTHRSFLLYIDKVEKAVGNYAIWFFFITDSGGYFWCLYPLTCLAPKPITMGPVEPPT